MSGPPWPILRGALDRPGAASQVGSSAKSKFESDIALSRLRGFEPREHGYAEVWARLDPAGRSAFLNKRHFRVYATKKFVRLERGEGEWTWRAYYDRQLGVTPRPAATWTQVVDASA